MPQRTGHVHLLTLFALVLLVTRVTRSALFAFGRAVLSFCWWVVFPRGARKNDPQKIEKYHAAVRPELVEGQAGLSLQRARPCNSGKLMSPRANMRRL